MLQFIKIDENRTPTDAELGTKSEFCRLVPSIYIGHPDAYSIDEYDIIDKNTPKHLKITTASPFDNRLQTVFIDTTDLISNFDNYGSRSGEEGYSGIRALDKNKDGNLSVLEACPVKFQRIHFNAQKPNGSTAEYYSIFLAGFPVPIAPDATFYADSGHVEWCPEYGNRFKLDAPAAEKTEYYKNRLIIGGSSLEYSFQIKRVYFEGDNLYVDMNGGTWAHRYSQVSISDQIKYPINASLASQYIYAEIGTDGGISIGSQSSNSYPISSSQYLRRAIGLIQIDVAKKTVSYFKNCQIGDIVTW